MAEMMEERKQESKKPPEVLPIPKLTQKALTTQVNTAVTMSVKSVLDIMFTSPPSDFQKFVDKIEGKLTAKKIEDASISYIKDTKAASGGILEETEQPKSEFANYASLMNGGTTWLVRGNKAEFNSKALRIKLLQILRE